MNAQLKTLLSLGSLLAIGALTLAYQLQSSSEPGDRREQIKDPLPIEMPPLEEPESNDSELKPERKQAKVVIVEDKTLPPVAGSPEYQRTVKGTVLDFSSREPIANLQLRLENSRHTTTSSADGRFLMDVDQLEGSICVEDPEWTTVRSAMLSEANAEHPVFVAKRVNLIGHVFSTDGRPLTGCKLNVYVDTSSLRDERDLLTRSERRLWTAKADGEAAFELLDVPALEQATLTVTHSAHEPLVVQTIDCQANGDHWSEGELRLELTPLDRITLEGIVKQPDETRSAGAIVKVANRSVQTDATGHFSVDFPLNAEQGTIECSNEGFLPASQIIDLSRSNTFLELTLGPPAVSLAGRVLDEKGQPRDGLNVELFSAPETSLVPLASTRTRSDGSFEFSKVEAGAYAVWTTSRDQDPWTVRREAQTGGTPITIEIGERELTQTDVKKLIKGRVDNESPNASQSIVRLSAGPRKGRTRGTAVRANGNFRIERAPGPWTLLELVAENGESQIQVLPPEQPRRDVVLSMK